MVMIKFIHHYSFLYLGHFLKIFILNKYHLFLSFIEFAYNPNIITIIYYIDRLYIDKFTIYYIKGLFKIIYIHYLINILQR